ncbi:MAG: cyclophilin family peptidyl-prolyl cis-trans isomerase [Verrucomicrobiales bacterium]|jgi:cyclophilin family peptidyl-prolyl cis-trans isomerase
MRIAHLLSAALLFASIATTPAAPPTLQNQSWSLRHPDGLLGRPDLQEVVAAQGARDAKALEKYFAHSDRLVRARAAFAAGSVQDPENIPGLVKLLDDSDPRVRIDAAFALRQTEGAPSAALFEQLKNETDADVRAMLLGALGFQGDRDHYEKILASDFSDLEVATTLCAIYYLQRDIVSPAGIERILPLLEHGNPEVREHAAYFFYTLTRRKTAVPKLVEKLSARVRSAPYDDIAAPYLLRYVAARARPADVELLLNWSRHGKSVRARSVAVEGLKHFTTDAKSRRHLIVSCCDPHFHVADTAAEILSACEHLDATDITSIKAALTAALVRPGCEPHLWGMLWRRGEKEFVEQEIAKVSVTNQIALINVISAAPDIALSKISSHLDALIASPNPQVNTLTGSYLAARLAHSEAAEDFDMFERFLDEVPDIRVRSETLFEMAASVGDRFASKASAEWLARYYAAVLAAEDLTTAAACVQLLGATRQPSALPIIKEAMGHPEAIIRLAARGALSLHEDGLDKPVNHGGLDYAPVLEVDWALLENYGRHPHLVMTTDLGDIVIQLDAEQAPLGAQNLIIHAEAGRFDGLHLYRVVPNHVIQAGPQGNFGYRILSEFTRIPKVEHSFGIGDYGKDTGSHHIAITHLMRPHNEGKYTNLGLVVAGREIVKNVGKHDLILKTKVIPASDPNPSAK